MANAARADLRRWQFFIDVGGTFTDCVAIAPDGGMRTAKVLSSGRVKGAARVDAGGRVLHVLGALPGGESFWNGSTLLQLDSRGNVIAEDVVDTFSTVEQRLKLLPPLSFPASMPTDDSMQIADVGLSADASVVTFELVPGLDAPLLAIRLILGLPPGTELPLMDVRLGTTRGTNALLERKGARTALVITQGFRDLLTIGNQDRPRLFDLTIVKPSPLAERVLEVDERLSADGTVLRPLDALALRESLQQLHREGVESLAICLMHAYLNPQHEQEIEAMAREIGFDEISLSSRVAPRIKIVSRCDTSVLDAYLTPVLRSYLGRIRRELSGLTSSLDSLTTGVRSATVNKTQNSSLRLITSSGGIIDSELFTGKDSILSGPAGGVIGFSRVAERAGFPRSIGFDMGGTSTDVSRYDGRYDLEYESRKAGVRIVTPMLAIETVAAGGGSICQFDGVQLRVGPESAGSDPGPACYGRGGPLTVTDLNVLLGRLPVDEFPFPLDTNAARRRLDDLLAQIAVAELGRKYTWEELASGLLEIANAHMIRAVRRISVEKGYHPADDVLVNFGGAGGLHVCTLARELGVKTILSHPLAGILSAYGIGHADVRRHGERPVLRRWNSSLLQEVEPTFLELEAELTLAVVDEGVPESRIAPPIRSLDIRYLGTDSTLTITAPDAGVPEVTSFDFPEAYAVAHQQLFGYRRENRELEVVALRVEVVGPSETLAEHSSGGESRSQQAMPTKSPPEDSRSIDSGHRTHYETSSSARTATVYCGGKWQAVPLLHRRDLLIGQTLNGPAIVSEETSTLFVEPGFRAEVASGGEVILRQTIPSQTVPLSTDIRADSEAVACDDDITPDPVTLEVFNHQFAAIAEQMGLTLQRTAVSTNVKERLDFSCALFDAVGNLIVNAPHIPVHLGAMGETVRHILNDNPEMQPGDVFISNDPFRGGSHLPDVTVVSPVHDAKTGQLLFLTASRAHHAEIGGIAPGSMPPFSKRLSEEGVLIRNFVLVHRGTSREDELRDLLLNAPYPTRDVESNLADIRAQVAANALGIAALHRLITRYSWPTVERCMQGIRLAAATQVRRTLQKLPQGTLSFCDHLDNGSPIVVSITIANSMARVDFTGTGPVLGSNLNANRAIVTAAVMYVFRCLIDEDIPLNSGVLEPIEIVLPDSLLNPLGHADPTECAAMVGGNVETSQRVVDVLLGALGVAAASQGTMNNLTFGNERFGYYETICGGSGATPAGQGASGVHTHMTNTRLTDPEVLEHRYPVRLHEFSIRRGSGGKGEHNGGDGVTRHLEFLEPLHVAMLSQRRGPYPPFGLNGGDNGALGINSFRPSGTHEWHPLPGSFQQQLAPGDQLRIQTPGAGAWSSPRD
ncbi:MAG: hydantoinase B/oxoprolinase family protein [Planctomycetaceae bacterium]